VVITTEKAQVSDSAPVTSMAGCLCISLEFDGGVSARVRPRILYAFRVFAAIYGHAVVLADSAAATIRCCYGGPRLPTRDPRVVHVPALYDAAALESGDAKLVKHSYAGESFHLSFGLSETAQRPDWLGEIFVWLSSSRELATSLRDDVGRVPYSETIFSRAGISPRTPHASLLMAWLENEIRGGSTEALPKAPSPVPGTKHIVLASHDLDFYFVDRRSAFVRLAKNLVIAAKLYKNKSFFSDNLGMMSRLLAGERPGDYLPRLLDAMEQEGARTTIFPAARRAHRRDPNYSLECIAPQLAKAAQRGFSVGLHGSYRSVMEDRSLPSESAILEERIGKRPSFNRQHWLRFDNHSQLFREVERAGFLADSSLGFPDMVGFRNGASFAFPPYDFEREAPHQFLEIPLILMDGGLEAATRALRADPKQLAEEVLQESRKYGWGGISLLWHNPLEPLSVPTEINRVFWQCARQRTQFHETWMTFDQFLSLTLPRYQQAGLLEGVRVHA